MWGRCGVGARLHSSIKAPLCTLICHPIPYKCQSSSFIGPPPKADKEQALFEDETKELARCLESDQKLLKAQAERLERMLGGPDDDELVQEDPEGPLFEEAILQLAQV